MDQTADLLQALADTTLEFQERQDQINTQSYHHLCHHCIVRIAQKGFDFQVLLDPFEEQLHLPALFVNLSDGLGGPVKMVGGEDIMLATFRVSIPHPPDRAQIIFTGPVRSIFNDLIAGYTL